MTTIHIIYHTYYKCDILSYQAALALLGIDQIGTELENPFGDDHNDIDVQVVIIIISSSIRFSSSSSSSSSSNSSSSSSRSSRSSRSSSSSSRSRSSRISISIRIRIQLMIMTLEREMVRMLEFAGDSGARHKFIWLPVPQLMQGETKFPFCWYYQCY